MSWYRVVPSLIGAVVALGVGQAAEAQGCTYAACTGLSRVDHTFASGTRWTFSVQNCPCEGMVIQAASFTPRGGTQRLVLSNGQSVDGQDVVLWYVNRHLHVPRDEDQLNMPVEWMSFSLKPRGFHHQSPLEL